MEHPISELMQTAMSSMKDMVDVNTVVGHPVQASSGSTIIPISRVTFGYMTAGGDLLADKPAKDCQQGGGTGLVLFVGGKQHSGGVAIAGGSGAGVSVQPVGFLVLSGDTVRMLPATCSSVADRVVDLIPTVVEDVKSFLTHQ